MTKPQGRRLDQYATVSALGRFDLGWATAVYDGRSVTRTCKGCGVSATSAAYVDDADILQVEPRPLHHADACPELVKIRAGRYS